MCSRGRARKYIRVQAVCRPCAVAAAYHAARSVSRIFAARTLVALRRRRAHAPPRCFAIVSAVAMATTKKSTDSHLGRHRATLSLRLQGTRRSGRSSREKSRQSERHRDTWHLTLNTAVQLSRQTSSWKLPRGRLGRKATLHGSVRYRCPAVQTDQVFWKLPRGTLGRKATLHGSVRYRCPAVQTDQVF